VDFWGVIPLVLGLGIGNLIVKGQDSWGKVFERWIDATVVVIVCYLCWFVL
jgi:hypothetical protein